MMENDLYLEHHGVKGMKWGRRKQRQTENQASNSRNTSKSSNIKVISKNRKREISKKEESFINKGLVNAMAKKERKEKVKLIAKASVTIAGAAIATSLLGYAGYMAYNDNFEKTGYFDENGNKHFYSNNTLARSLSTGRIGGQSVLGDTVREYGTRSDGTRVLRSSRSTHRR